jgi:phage/plasmid-associated DNA primase
MESDLSDDDGRKIKEAMNQWVNYIVSSLDGDQAKHSFPSEKLLEKLLEHKGGEAYHNLYDLEPRPAFKGYQGKTRPACGWFSFDFDSEGDISHAMRDATKFIEFLNVPNIHVFFTGSKGFHVSVQEEFFGIAHDENCAPNYRRLVHQFKDELVLSTLDTSITNATRKFRVPGSRHPKTGLYKTELDLGKFVEGAYTVEDIKFLASSYKKPGRWEKVPGEPAPHLRLKDTVKKSATTAVQGANSPGVLDKETARDYEAFEKYDKKLCIKKLLSNRCDEGGRHRTIQILITDYYRTGRTIEDTRKDLLAWATKQGLVSEGRWGTYETLIDRTFAGLEPYSYGCVNTPEKRRNCSGKCGIYAKLKKEHRPEVFDAPARLDRETQLENHQRITDAMVESFQGNLVKQDKDLFRWTKTHWLELSQQDLDSLKLDLLAKLDHSTEIDSLNRAYQMMCLKIPAVPPGKNMYQPNPFAANFKNGTLWLKRNASSGVYELEFLPHRREDFLTTVLDLEYSENYTENVELKKILDEILEGDPEKEEKLRAFKQAAAAMLMPAFPRIFFFLGDPGSRKSTFLKVFLRAFGGTSYFSMVEPVQMYGFLTESMLNKTVNMHLDVSEKYPIPDSFLKTNEDRVPRLINRKGRRAVEALVPAVHLFGANNLPPTQTKNQNVYDRRVTIIQFTREFTSSGVYKRDYEDLVLGRGGKAGLVSFAMEGLRDLIASDGLYFQPGSGRLVTKAWQERASDVVQDFIRAIEEQEVTVPEVNTPDNLIKTDMFGSLNRTTLWKAFVAWCVKQGYPEGNLPLKQSPFYREIEARGFKSSTYQGERRFKGLVLGAPLQAEF